jgi:hypothetical protein
MDAALSQEWSHEEARVQRSQRGENKVRSTQGGRVPLRGEDFVLNPGGDFEFLFLHEQQELWTYCCSLVSPCARHCLRLQPRRAAAQRALRDYFHWKGCFNGQ